MPLFTLCSGALRLQSASAITPVRHIAPPSSSFLKRTFFSNQKVLDYVMPRAKVANLVFRSALAYNEMIKLNNASSPLSHCFIRSATLRDRARIYLICLTPPDEPIDIPDFLDGAKHAAHVVFEQIYSEEGQREKQHPSLLLDMADSKCIDIWATKMETQRKALDLAVGTKFKLEELLIHDVRLADAEYVHAAAKTGQKKDTRSMYYMNEALSLTVRFSVTEHLLASSNDNENHSTRHTLTNTFDWRFYSNVSRARLVDWRITHATPFKMESKST